MRCEHCSTKFLQLKGNKRKRFCSLRCCKNAAYRRKNPKFAKRSSCGFCGKRFIAFRRWHLYCSHLCGQKARDKVNYAIRKASGANREHWFQGRYGISLSERDAMAQQQGNKCAVCGEIKRLVVDHDHVTGAIRGLLCYACNSGLDYFWKLRVEVARYLKQALVEECR